MPFPAFWGKILHNSEGLKKSYKILKNNNNTFQDVKYVYCSLKFIIYSLSPWEWMVPILKMRCFSCLLRLSLSCIRNGWDGTNFYIGNRMVGSIKATMCTGRYMFVYQINRYIYIYIYNHFQLGKLKMNCLLLKLNRKLRKILLI